MTPEQYDELVEMLADVGSRFVATVIAIDDPAWSAPGLGEWSVRELVGHTIRAFSTIDRFLDEPLEQLDCDSAAAYYRVALSTPGIHAVVAERGRETAAALGDDPRESVVEQISSTMGRLGRTDGTEIGATAAGGTRLSDYLETRLVELVVHYSDLCAALGTPVGDLGPAGVRVAATVFASATPTDQDRILRAMLGREALPDGFNVWP